MPLEISHQDHWTELTLSQPPRNVLDVPLLTAFVAALDDLWEAAPPLLIRATGKHFSTGYPISDIPAEIFAADPAVRPIERIGRSGGERKRARPVPSKTADITWSWGDGEGDDE